MKKFKFSYDDKESVVMRSSLDVALKDVLEPLASPHSKIKSGEKVTLSISVERLPFTKSDIAAREMEREKRRQRKWDGRKEYSPEEIEKMERQLQQDRLGDIMVDEDAQVLGFFQGYSDSGAMLIHRREGLAELPRGLQMAYNISAHQRLAGFRQYCERNSNSDGASDELAALGL